MYMQILYVFPVAKSSNIKKYKHAEANEIFLEVISHFSHNHLLEIKVYIIRGTYETILYDMNRYTRVRKNYVGLHKISG